MPDMPEDERVVEYPLSPEADDKDFNDICDEQATYE